MEEQVDILTDFSLYSSKRVFNLFLRRGNQRMKDNTKSTRHAKYNLNYHFVWIPKYRRKVSRKSSRTWRTKLRSCGTR